MEGQNSRELVRIKPVDENTIDDLREGFLRAFLKVYQPYTPNDLGIKEETKEEWLEKTFAEMKGDIAENLQQCFILRNNKEIVGFVTTKIAQETVYIAQLCVFEPYQRKGHARAIIDGLIYDQYPSAKEFIGVCRKKNELACRAYEHMGAKKTSETIVIQYGYDPKQYFAYRAELFSRVPNEIDSRSAKARQAYYIALKEGESKPLRSKLMIVGPAMVGKTHLMCSLTNQPFTDNNMKTNGAHVCDISIYPWKVHLNEKTPSSDSETAVKQAVIEELKKTSGINTNFFHNGSEATINAKITNRETQDTRKNTNYIPKREFNEIFGAITEGVQDVSPGDHFSLNIWDFAGQEVYYTVHHLFLTGNSFYIVVFNMEEAINNNIDGDPNRNSWLKKLYYWINSIQIHAPESPVLIVGTHKDKVPEKEQWLLLSKQLKSAIFPNKRSGAGPPKHSAAFSNIVRNREEPELWFFAVDNKGVNDHGIRQLRDEIMTIIKEKRENGFLNKRIPIKWFQFQEQMTAKMQDNFITLAKAKEIANRCGITDNEQFKTMMQFFHDIGILIHYKGRPLTNFVIINPQWLVDVIRCVITVEQYWSQRELNPNELESIKRGYFNQMILSKLWSAYPNHIDQFIHIMSKFGLMEKYDKDNFLVPSLLPKSPAPWDFSCIGVSCYLVFEDFLPAGLFHYLSVYCIQESRHEKDFLSFNSCIVSLKKQLVLLELLDAYPMIKVTVRLSTKKAPKDALSSVEEKIKRLQRTWMKGLKYEVKLPCPHCSARGGKCFFTFNMRHPPFCVSINQEIDVTKIYSQWMSPSRQADGCHLQKTLKGVSASRRAEIAHRIATNANWSLLGLYFEIELGTTFSREWLVASFKDRPDKELCHLLLEEFAKRGLPIISFRRVLESPSFGMNDVVAEFPEL